MLAMLGVLSGCSNSKVKDEENRIAANNAQNCINPAFATDGEWIYYTGAGLRKLKLSDGTEDSLVTDKVTPEKLSYIGNKLYFTNGGGASGYIKLNKESSVEYLNLGIDYIEDFQTDGKYYYVSGTRDMFNDDSGVYRVKGDKKENCSKIMDAETTSLILQDDYLYVTSPYATVNGEENSYKGIWRISLDGKEKIQLFDYCPGYFIVLEDDIYYTDENERLCSMKLDGTENIVYEDIYIKEGLNATEDYIFYIDKETEIIHRMKHDGTENIELNDNLSSWGISIVGDWLIYYNWDEGEYYKMNFDGTINCLLNESISE